MGRGSLNRITRIIVQVGKNLLQSRPVVSDLLKTGDERGSSYTEEISINKSTDHSGAEPDAKQAALRSA